MIDDKLKWLSRFKQRSSSIIVVLKGKLIVLLGILTYCDPDTWSHVPTLHKIQVYKINKNLKFKKGVRIAIKSKETSSKLAI